jgi:transketolase
MTQDQMSVLPQTRYSGIEIVGQTLVEIGRQNPAIWVITADVMHSTKIEAFALAFCDRFVNVGVAEQTMVGVAAGLATCGKVPFVAAFAAMLTMRACEQIRTDVAYPGLSVKLLSTHSGFSLGPGGTTHHATEDIAIMRSIAHMTILVPCDSFAAAAAVKAAAEWPGPVYVRLRRGADPVVYSSEPAFEIGKAIELRQGSDVTLIGCGRTVIECLRAADQLAEHAIEARVFDMHTVKPIDRAAIEHAAAHTNAIFTVEEHNCIGGLGGAVAEVLSDMGHAVPLRRIGLPDIFASIGPQNDLLDKYGLTSEGISNAVLDALNRPPSARGRRRKKHDSKTT